MFGPRSKLFDCNNTTSHTFGLCNTAAVSRKLSHFMGGWEKFSPAPLLPCSTAPRLHCSPAPLLHCSPPTGKRTVHAVNSPHLAAPSLTSSGSSNAIALKCNSCFHCIKSSLGRVTFYSPTSSGSSNTIAIKCNSCFHCIKSSLGAYIIIF